MTTTNKSALSGAIKTVFSPLNPNIISNLFGENQIMPRGQHSIAVRLDSNGKVGTLFLGDYASGNDNNLRFTTVDKSTGFDYVSLNNIDNTGDTHIKFQIAGETNPIYQLSILEGVYRIYSSVEVKAVTFEIMSVANDGVDDGNLLTVNEITIQNSTGTGLTSDIIKIKDTNSQYSTTLQVPSLNKDLDFIYPSTQGENNQVLKLIDGTGHTGWVKDSIGVSSDEAKLNSIAKYANNDGQSIKKTGILIDDSNNITGIASLTTGDITTTNLELMVSESRSSSITKDFSTLGDVTNLRQDLTEEETDNKCWGVVFRFKAGQRIRSGDIVCFNALPPNVNSDQIIRVFNHKEVAASLPGAGIIGVAQSTVDKNGDVDICTSGITTVRCLSGEGDFHKNCYTGSILTGGVTPGLSYANSIYGPKTASVGFSLEFVENISKEDISYVLMYVSTGFQGI